MRENYNILRLLGKAILYTFVIILVVIAMYVLINNSRNITAEQSDVSFIICFLIGIIFTIFLCTLIIIEAIKNK